MHNTFNKCTDSLEGGRASQLAYDLHTWFKDRPCKKDFINLFESITINEESIFLRIVPRGG